METKSAGKLEQRWDPRQATPSADYCLELGKCLRSCDLCGMLVIADVSDALVAWSRGGLVGDDDSRAATAEE